MTPEVLKPKEKKKYQFSLVKEWFTEDKENRRLDEVYGDGYQTWIDNHFDEVIYHKEESRMIMNFIGWLDSMGMQNEYTFSMGSLDDCVWFNPKEHQFQNMEPHIKKWKYRIRTTFILARGTYIWT